MSVQVTVDTTPNEHALKFSVNQQILDSGYKTFNSMEDAKDFPVAEKILKTKLWRVFS
jgi:hypothetical protein